jgi:hypothetical protein
MTTLEFRWTTSRGRDSYGYNICSLLVDGRKVSSCNGGGYDMKGTALANWIERAYAGRLNTLTAADMPAQRHWERAENPRRFCTDIECAIKHGTGEPGQSELCALPGDAETCPHCGKETRVDYHDGRTVDDGRYFYGLTYHDPNYDPGKAQVGADCDDLTLGGANGLTVEEAEAQGKSLGLERYQAFYRASSHVPTPRHTAPSIHGACGIDSVEAIMRAIGLTIEYVPTKSKRNSVYLLHDARAEKSAA